MYEFFSRPTPTKTVSTLALGLAILGYAVKSESPIPYSFLLGLALMGYSSFTGFAQAIMKLNPHGAVQQPHIVHHPYANSRGSQGG